VNHFDYTYPTRPLQWIQGTLRDEFRCHLRVIRALQERDPPKRSIRDQQGWNPRKCLASALVNIHEVRVPEPIPINQEQIDWFVPVGWPPRIKVYSGHDQTPDQALGYWLA
jgi:hypothetical protein